jgi:hypothetical protein
LALAMQTRRRLRAILAERPQTRPRDQEKEREMMQNNRLGGAPRLRANDGDATSNAALMERVQTLRSILPGMATEVANARREAARLRRENARLQSLLEQLQTGGATAIAGVLSGSVSGRSEGSLA